MTKIAELIATYSKFDPDLGGLDFVNAESNLWSYLKDLNERLLLGTGTTKLQNLSDGDAAAEAAAYLLWKSLNGSKT